MRSAGPGFDGKQVHKGDAMALFGGTLVAHSPDEAEYPFLAATE